MKSVLRVRVEGEYIEEVELEDREYSEEELKAKAYEVFKEWHGEPTYEQVAYYEPVEREIIELEQDISGFRFKVFDRRWVNVPNWNGGCETPEEYLEQRYQQEKKSLAKQHESLEAKKLKLKQLKSKLRKMKHG